MNLRNRTALTLLLFAIFLPLGRTTPPNILLILADDMGYGDMGYMGSEVIRTPHLDRLAQSGVFCEQGYVASSVCSPSRAGLLTGRDPRRFGYEGNLNRDDKYYAARPELLGLAPGEHTLGDHLRSAGYATALIGKWHQGIGPGFHPNERGFDYFCGMLQGSHSYFPEEGSHTIERNGEPVTTFSSSYLTDFFTDEGIDWMAKQQAMEQPWFVFMSYNAPHTPMHATAEDLARFAHIKDEKRRTYAAMMWAMDRGVGRMREWLSEQGELENTLIVFFSDNGGPTQNGSWNGPLSGGKGALKEGGVRVPMIWSWPGALPKNSRYPAPVSALDLVPSFMAAAASSPLPLRSPMTHEDPRNFRRGIERYGAYDGIDVLPYLRKEKPPRERTLFWRLQGQASIRRGPLKLLRLSHRPAELFRPDKDPGELTDLADEAPNDTRALFEALAEWEAMLPTVPLWDSSPYWSSQSAKYYDQRKPSPEPR